jgi:hypothetical protein
MIIYVVVVVTYPSMISVRPGLCPACNGESENLDFRLENPVGEIHIPLPPMIMKIMKIADRGDVQRNVGLELHEVVTILEAMEVGDAYTILFGKPEGKRPLVSSGRRMGPREIRWEVVDWMHLAQDWD